MKYQHLNIDVPVTKRDQYNKKIVNLILTGEMGGISAEEVFNIYTGKGKLHGLSRNDFDNYYEFSEAKKEFEQGQFFTPSLLCKQIIECLNPEARFKIADLTCGTGNFFNYLPQESNLFGNEIDDVACTVCKYLYPEATIQKGDFLYYNPEQSFDLIIGNPPFNLRTTRGVSQYAYIEKSWELLNLGGILSIIVPESFLQDEFQDKSKIEWINDHFDFIFQSKLPSNSFEAVIATKLIALRKKGISNISITWQPESFEAFDPLELFTKFIAPIYEENHRLAPKIHLLNVQQSIRSLDEQYNVRKYLWHIKSNPKLKEKYHARALAKLQQLKTQVKPSNMDDKEWERSMLTPARVARWMRSILIQQNDKPPREILKVVKTNYGLKLKAYHKTLQQQSWTKSVHDMLLTGERFAVYKKLYDRKKRNFDKQTIEFNEMEQDATINSFLDNFELIPISNNGLLFPEADAPVIRLNPMQKNDLGLILQKRYGILAWEMGGGKSVAGMTWIKYWKDHYTNCFILAPALAINTTWTERLALYNFDCMQIESISDIARIKPGQLILISYDRLVNLQRFIKKFIKQASYKIAVLIDESDELTNASSQRSKAALNCFRKAKLKLLTTGTTTRNNINELYTQLELLYNNSTNFICWADRIYHTNKENDIIEVKNERSGYPFPAYGGAALFKACFCPQKSTVFGIKKETQDIYNSLLLKQIVAKTIITRKFEEIVGEKKYSIHTHTITQTTEEKALYNILLKDFMQVCYDFYTSTGNARKEAALRLIRQIKALIKATSVPHLMPHYNGNTQPGKYNAIKDLIADWSNELVAIGTIFKSTAHDYHAYLQTEFPHRKHYYIDGEDPVKKRVRMLAQFKHSMNGILVCTQQALKSSVNIPYCNKCIIESLQWNIPKISQFYFRFIRFDSRRHTEVHFINYENTIEINLLALLMAKEKLNDFIKTTNETSTAAIYDEFGIDLNILDMMIQKDHDKDGKLILRWGNQQLLK